MIPGVEIKQLTTHPDDRGFFREIIRNSDPFFAGAFGQWSHSKKIEGYRTPEFHVHQEQTDWWYCPIGMIHVALCDLRPGNDLIFRYYLLGGHELLGANYVIKIPPGVGHGFEVLEDGPAHLFYITSHEYNPADEGRIPNSDIDFNWSDGHQEPIK